jgi:hypothetical protein
MYDTKLLDKFDRLKNDILNRKEEHKQSSECVIIDCPICSCFEKEYRSECHRQAQFFKQDSGWGAF